MPREPNDLLHQLSRVSAIGTSFALTVIGMGALGYGADYLFHSKPIGIVIGLGMGLLGGGYKFVREATAAAKASARSTAATDGKPGPSGKLWKPVEDDTDADDSKNKP